MKRLEDHPDLAALAESAAMRTMRRFYIRLREAGFTESEAMRGVVLMLLDGGATDEET
jgi:hypothetical protein